MHYQLEHVAIHCRDINESIKFYEKFFGGSPTAIRKGAAGYGFCFMKIDGAPSIQLMESSERGRSSPLWIRHRQHRTGSPKSSKKRVRKLFVKIVIHRADLQPFLSKILTVWS